MITLNEIAYNIKNLAYGGSTSTENSISLRQIKHWIHYHRAKLIADNIDKGITNNQALYQKMVLTARNSTNSTIKDFYDGWDAYDIDSSLTPPTITGSLLSNYPKKSASVDRLNGEWMAHSSLSIGNYGWSDDHSRSFYGDEISSFQLRGDFRNYGAHSFQTPRPLQLKNDQGIKNVHIRRFVYFPDDPVTPASEQEYSYGKKEMKLYRKEYNNFDEYNKFTNHSKPYYTQEISRIDKDYGHEGYNYISFRGLQVSPNYHGGLKTPSNQKIFWKYRGAASMILENPTEIDMMWGWWWGEKIDWDDDKNPYPIPMEYVSDLIQRVIQVEMQTELKTIPDIVTDGVDDVIKLKTGGAQVQR
jgi:hypothetical protein